MIGGFLTLALAWLLPTWFGDQAAAYPSMHEVNQSVQLASAFILGGAALIVSHLAVTRATRHGAEALVATLALTRAQRIAAHLLALVPLVPLTGIIVAARVMTIGADPHAVGSVAPHEMAVGPFAVLLLGAVGVLLGSATALTVTGPVTVALLFFATFGSVLFAPANGLRIQALLPVTYDEVFLLPIPSALVDRRDDWHLLYLIAGTALIALAALLASGYRPLWSKVTAFLTAVAVGVVAWIQVKPPDQTVIEARATATSTPASQQVCERRSEITYCAWPEFKPWFDSWDRIARGALTRVPPDVAAQPLAVRQRVNAANPLGLGSGTISKAPVDSWSRDDELAGTPNAVIAETTWGRPEDEFGLASRLAYAVVSGNPPPANIAAVCGAQSLVTLWIAVGASESAKAGLEELRSRGGGGVFMTTAGFGTGVAFTHASFVLLRAMSELPENSTREKVFASWKKLTEPSTTLHQAAEILGIATARIPPVGDSRCQEKE